MRTLFTWLRGGWLAALTCTLLAPGTAGAALFERPAQNLQNEVQQAAARGKRLALFLTLPDCPGCLEMERTVFAERGIEAAFGRRFHGLRLDIGSSAPIVGPLGEALTPADYARRVRAVATPSFVFLDEQGRVIYRYTGTLDAAGFRALNDYVAKESYETRPFSPPAKRSERPLALHAEAPDTRLPLRPDWRLSATDGRWHKPADFHGQIVALAVGYTHCPDVCPTTLAELRQAIANLPAAQRRKVRVLFATLDPERDTLAFLRDYVAAFRPAGAPPFLGLRGNPEETARFIAELRLVAEKQPAAGMGYSLDHTAGIFLVDGTGRLRGLLPYGAPVEQLIHDLGQLAATLP